MEELYTGEEILAYHVYAQYFTVLWSVLTFSSGMPALYPIACLNFVILYWVYKILLVKFYRKTTAFNQDLPNSSIAFLKIAILTHVVLAAYIFTNSHLLSSDNALLNLETIIQLVSSQSELIDEEYLHKIEHQLAEYSFGRFLSGLGVLYLLFMAIVFVFWALWRFTGGIFRYLFENLMDAVF